MQRTQTSEPLVIHEEDLWLDDEVLALIDSGSISLSRQQYFNLNSLHNSNQHDD